MPQKKHKPEEIVAKLRQVASFLILIARHIDPSTDGKPGLAFELPMSRADIADFLGLTIETVSRQMSKLRVEGLVAITNNRSEPEAP